MGIELITIDDMAGRFGIRANRVAYIILKNRIPHVKRVGATRVFDPKVADVVAKALCVSQRVTLNNKHE